MRPGLRAASGVLLVVTALLLWWLNPGAARDDDPAAAKAVAIKSPARSIQPATPRADPAAPARTTPGEAASSLGDSSDAAGPAVGGTQAASASQDSIAGVAVEAGNMPAASDSNEGKDEEQRFPRHWRRCFRNPGAQADYQIASNPNTAWSGSFSANIASEIREPAIAGAGLCQSIAANLFRGRRVRFTLHMRTLNAMPGAHLVFRTESSDGRLLSLYNMLPRHLRGTTQWAAHSVVIQIPEQATLITVGGTLMKTGSLWIDDALLEVVGPEVPLTPLPPTAVQYFPAVSTAGLTNELRNGGFEETTTSAPL